jgi:hypothetical protein
MQRTLILLLTFVSALVLSAARTAGASPRGSGYAGAVASSGSVPTGLYGVAGAGLTFSVIGGKIRYVNWGWAGGSAEDIKCTNVDYNPQYHETGPIPYWVGIGELGFETGVIFGFRLAHPVAVRSGRRFSLHEHLPASALFHDPPFNSEGAQIEAAGPADGGQLDVNATPRRVRGVYEIDGNAHYGLTSPSYLGTCAAQIRFRSSKNSLKRAHRRRER